ncbi:MAG TPA: 40S ribosomal protein S19 [Candidatus Lokiarchaeia archaeon]|nr:40S ribosomal protein S19 [Candidatus Lokiarchaeia archaeon]
MSESAKPLPPISNIFSVSPDTFIQTAAQKLKTFPEINPPKEVKLGLWKTSCAREFPPENCEDFWYIRSASLLRKLAIKKQIGVSRLRKQYGCHQRNGNRPPHFRKCSGKIIRKSLQMLEKAGLVQVEKGAGRKLTSAGQSFIDKIAHDIMREATAAE